jgi:hypothetical protein
MATAVSADYSKSGSAGGTSGGQSSATKYADLGKLKKFYSDYLGTKREEIDEQKEARRYYHGSHWTAEQIKVLKKRKQPIVTYNRVARKIDGVVGLLERIRQDPKGFPRTPKHEEGAELATAVLRYVLDQQDWNAKSPICARDGAIEGVAGIELEITQGDQGDNEVSFEVVETDGFFYDPRSSREDFSDARYMGMGKWVDSDTASELFPDFADQFAGMADDGEELSTNSDRETKWFSSDAGKNRIRLVDCWYKHQGKWCYSIFTGSTVIMEGESYLIDEKKKTFCKYVMFSGNVDQDGDRYGFVRNLKSAQNEINQRRSKALHMANSRRLIVDEGSVRDIETTRREWARPDGVIVKNMGMEVKPEDQSIDLAGQLKFLEDAKTEVENFGPNPALIGQGIENRSGRAIALLQQAGMAELGPYLLSYKGWKIRVYRALWNAVQHHWTAERWIRVTDDQQVAQFIQINGLGTDPMTGQPTIVNAIGSLDVDIIIDEGADQITTAAETFEALSTLLPNVAPMLSPPEAKVVLEAMFESSPLPGSIKKKFRDGMKAAQEAQSQPNPAQQIQLAGEQAKVKETESRAMLNMAKARDAMTPEQQQMGEPGLPMPLQAAESMADIDDTRAATELKQAQTAKIVQDMSLAPQKLAMDAANKAADRDMRSRAPAI